MTTATVAAKEQADRVITVPEAAAGGTTPHSIAVVTGAVPRLAKLRTKILTRALAIARMRAPLLASMVVISVLAIRMIAVNTAFLDEATYLSAGHVIWHNWLHGGPDMKFETYFSGAPVIYPVIVAVADAVGGLYAARVLSLLCVLVTLGLVDGTTRRLFNNRAAGWAVVLFATVEGTQFLAAFATYDAMALMLLALAVWCSIRYLDSPRELPHAGLYLGVPILAFANATKYATGLYDPVVIGVVAFAFARRYGWRQGARVGLTYTAMLGAFVAAGLAIGGARYATGINSTTLQRPPGTSSVSDVIDSSLRWVGPLTVVCLVGVGLLARRLRKTTPAHRSLTDIANLGLLTVLSAAILLAPVEQARVRTTISLQKHVGFGAWFAAIAAGALIAEFSGPWLAAVRTKDAKRKVWLRWAPAALLVVPLALTGRAQAVELHNSWPNSVLLTTALAPYVEKSDRPILMDDSEITQYYLGTNTDPRRWNNTYYLRYPVPGTQTVLTGPAAYRSAIAHDHFGLVALNFGSQNAIDRVVQNAITANKHYRYLGAVRMQGAYGFQTYVLWQDKHLEQIPWV